jgi:hypothetical protein
VEAEEERADGAHKEQVKEIGRQASNPYLSHGVRSRIVAYSAALCC